MSHSLWHRGEPPLAGPVLLDPPWLLGNIDNPNVGDNWQIELTSGGTHHKATFWVESVTATVVVPAGRFLNCIKVKQLDQVTISDSTEYKYRRYWLAPGVGPVKYTQYTRNWGTVKKNQKLVGYSLE